VVDSFAAIFNQIQYLSLCKKEREKYEATSQQVKEKKIEQTVSWPQ
jgi:hypothetical protein